MSETVYRKLLHAIKVTEIAASVRTQLINHTRAQMIKLGILDEAFLTDFIVAAEALEPIFLDDLEALHASHFSKEEAQFILEFYAHPIGQRVAALQPLIVGEAAALGQRHGERLEALMVAMHKSDAQEPS